MQNLLSKTLEKSSDPNIENEDGLTPLILAVHNNYMDGVDILLRSNANINYKIEDGRTALHFASELSSPDMIKKLIKFKINLN